MKPHIIIKFKSSLHNEKIPHWMDFINDKSMVVERFNNEVDQVFDSFNLKVWITREFSKTENSSGATDLDKIYRIIFQEEEPLHPGLLDKIEALNTVEYARSALVAKTEIPSPSISKSFTGAFDQSRNLIYLKQAHLFTKGHPSIKIAVLDTGVDWDHDELKGVVEQKKDFVHIDDLDTTSFIGDTTGYDNSPEDEVGHGTHVSGIICGKGNKIPVGVAPSCKIYAVRVLATMKQGDRRIGAGLIDNINAGIKWAVDAGADIINMSLGVKHEHGGLPHEEVVKYALRRGVSIVAASGNDGSTERYYPGALPGVIATSAVGHDGKIAPFSTTGKHVSISAPGVNILSSFIGNTYVSSSGTSQAAPFVTGTIALLKSFARERNKRISEKDIKYILKHTSDKTGTRYRDRKTGYGIVNAVDAIRLLDELISN